jgi:saccharopepsin
MGIRPNSHVNEMFKENSHYNDKGGHMVPVNNFLNAQCKFQAVM